MWPSKPTHHKTESVFKVTMSALGPILASLSSVTSMATVLADTVAQNHNLNERLQKQLAAKVERCIRETVAEQQATEYVQAHPDHVLEHKLPGLYLGKCEGDLVLLCWWLVVLAGWRSCFRRRRRQRAK